MTRSTKLLSDARSHTTSRLLYACRSNRFRDRNGLDWHVPRLSDRPSRTENVVQSESIRDRSISVDLGPVWTGFVHPWSDLAADMETGQTTLDDYDNYSIVDKILKFFISGNVTYKMNHSHVIEPKCMLQTLSPSHQPSHRPGPLVARLVANPGDDRMIWCGRILQEHSNDWPDGIYRSWCVRLSKMRTVEK